MVLNKIKQFRFSRPNSSQLLSYALFAFSICVLLFSIMATMNVDVIKDWKLTIIRNEIPVGDQAVIISEYTKVREVSGKSVRYIECRNIDGVWIRYPLNEARADRAKGTGGTGIPVVIPSNIPNLPTQCKFTIAIDYEVYPWRTVHVVNSTKEFTLVPR